MAAVPATVMIRVSRLIRIGVILCYSTNISMATPAAVSGPAIKPVGPRSPSDALPTSRENAARRNPRTLGNAILDLAEPQLGSFQNVVWKKGIRLVEYSSGYGAMADGYRLKRTDSKNSVICGRVSRPKNGAVLNSIDDYKQCAASFCAFLRQFFAFRLRRFAQLFFANQFRQRRRRFQ
jgi:hypothetical protein